jgi:hypothetical protein
VGRRLQGHKKRRRLGPLGRSLLVRQADIEARGAAILGKVQASRRRYDVNGARPWQRGVENHSARRRCCRNERPWLHFQRHQRSNPSHETASPSSLFSFTLSLTVAQRKQGRIPGAGRTARAARCTADPFLPRFSLQGREGTARCEPLFSMVCETQASRTGLG